jgi:hypothetical protein
VAAGGDGRRRLPGRRRRDCWESGISSAVKDDYDWAAVAHYSRSIAESENLDVPIMTGVSSISLFL